MAHNSWEKIIIFAEVKSHPISHNNIIECRALVEGVPYVGTGSHLREALVHLVENLDAHKAPRPCGHNEKPGEVPEHAPGNAYMWKDDKNYG